MFFSFFSYIEIKKINVLSKYLKKLPKMVKVIILVSLRLQNLLICCGDIEKNPGPKYSLSVIGISTVSQFTNLLKSRYFKHI